MAITAGLLMMSMVTGCSAGPAYHRPPVPDAPAYKEAQGVVWEPAVPGDHLLRGNWWEMYQDPLLDAFEERVDSGNQNVAAAAANYFAARALVRLARSQYYPTVTTSPSITYGRDAAIPIPTVSNQSFTATEFEFPVSVSWEPDLWARVRKSVAANTYAAQAAAADLENVRLLAHAELAIDYFQLRGTDEQKRILHATVLSYEDYLGLVRGLCKSGLDADEALAAAESALKAAQAQETNLGIARAEYEHAIAVLMGEAPSKVSIAVNPLLPHLPSIPVGIPADLLQRRPDIAAAERTMAQANAQIGVARAAFFPNVILGATGGIESLNVTDWFTWPSRFWSVGPVAAETIFDAGARRATVQQYRSLYDAAAANYRQTALTAFQQVEDQLAALNILSTDMQQQNEAVVSAQRYRRQAEVRNSAGLDPFLNVLTSEVSVLVYQQTYAVFETQQMVASVQLVEALGGGWTTAQLPSPKQVKSPVH